MSGIQMVQQGVGIVIALTVSLLVAAFVLPVGINEIVQVETTSWSDGGSALWEVLDLIAVLVLFLVFIGWIFVGWGGGRRSG